MTVSLRSPRARALFSFAALPLAAASFAACTDGGGGGAIGGGGACTPVEVISARGTTEPQTGSMIMGGLSRGIASRVGGNVYEVQYPSSAEYLSSPQIGVTDTLNRIKARAAACPNQKYVLNGYSKGGIVMTDVMKKISQDLGAKVKAVVMYGNPYYKANQPEAAGSAKGGMARGIYPGMGVPASWSARTKDFCNQGDPVCGAGANIAMHLAYGSTAQAEGISFAVSKVNAG
jgi:cutinase